MNINKATKVEYTNWLVSNFEQVYRYDDGSKEVDLLYPLAKYYKNSESIISAIARVYELDVSIDSRLEFKLALGDALRIVAVDDSRIEIAQDIIYLVARIKAVEAIDAIVPSISKLRYSCPELVYVTIAVLQNLAPSNQAGRAIDNLVNTHGFEDKYLLEALTTLIQCSPDKAPEYLLKYFDRLTRIHSLSEQADSDQIAKYLSRITKWIRKIDRISLDNWFDEFWRISPHDEQHTWFYSLIVTSGVVKPIGDKCSADSASILYRARERSIEINSGSWRTYGAMLRADSLAESYELESTCPSGIGKKMRDFFVRDPQRFGCRLAA